MKGFSDQRAPVENEIAETRSRAFRIRRSYAWVITLAGLLGSGALDFATDFLWIGPSYFVFIALAAWALGWREAMAILAMAVAFSVAANADSLYPYESPITIWDYLLRIPPVIAIIALLTYARKSCEREWHTARIDALTGALNRKAFFELAGSIEESKGWHILGYADLDGLKALNDKHGHARGDQCLKAFAAHVKKAIRRDDIFARVGGDEFLVYMPVRDEEAGMTVAHRLHRAMNSATAGFAEDLHCSVGVLILAPGPRSIDRELRAADELMYEAKQNGAALTVAAAREHEGSLAMARRWMLTGARAAFPQAERPSRSANRWNGDPADETGPSPEREDAAGQAAA